MADTSELMATGDRCIFNTYARFPIVLVRGENFKVWDSDGKEYYDFVSGLAVNGLGHCHPKVVEALQRQAATLIHVSNLYYIQPQIELARLLASHSFADRSFFCNSGAEAVEAAIKLARKYSHNKYGEGRDAIVTMHQSFHGRTMAAVTATAQDKFHKGFDPLVPGFVYVPFNDADATRAAVTEATCAILVEPIQGEGGVNVPDDGYLQALREICDEHGLLLIFDEVQVGLGRTGRLFAHEHYGVTPDVMTLAKALAGGTAIGAMLATEEAAGAFAPGTHGSTFGGNPLACAAGVAAFTALLEEKLTENAAEVGSYALNELANLQRRHSCIRDVRGKGLILGLELDRPGADVVKKCMARGVLINCTMDNVLRLLPPLTITHREVDLVVSLLDEVLGEMEQRINND